jgi:putative PIN family toxin of toxin-antitoxin system
VRAVLDPNVIISALLSPEGAPARAVRAWIQGEFELVVSPLLLQELSRALAYPKLHTRIEPEEAERVVGWLSHTATMTEDPDAGPPVRSPDPGDDDLIALAQTGRAALVSGDGHLLGLSDEFPVFSPTGFLDLLHSTR